MAEGVYLPADVNSNSEFFLKEIMGHSDVHDHVKVWWTRFVETNPPAIYEFYSSTFLNPFDHLLQLDILRFEPHLKEENVTDYKCSLFIVD